jgi:hypothetical protein
MKSEIYRDLYNFEMEQRGHLIDAANIPIVAITVLGGGLITMMMGFPYRPGGLQLGFMISSGIAAAALTVAIWGVFRSFIGYEYERPASPHIWQKHYEGLVKHYASKVNAAARADAEFERAFNARLADATDTNRANNRRRGNAIAMANISGAIALAALAFAGIFYVVATHGEKPPIHEIRIVS